VTVMFDDTVATAHVAPAPLDRPNLRGTPLTWAIGTMSAILAMLILLTLSQRRRGYALLVLFLVIAAGAGVACGGGGSSGGGGGGNTGTTSGIYQITVSAPGGTPVTVDFDFQ
jgi:hypothetical protein